MPKDIGRRHFTYCKTIEKFYNLYQTAKLFSLNTRMIKHWVDDVHVKKIKKSKEAREIWSKMPVSWPWRRALIVSTKAYDDKLSKWRVCGSGLEQSNFSNRCIQILSTFLIVGLMGSNLETGPTNTSQRPAADKREAIQQFPRTRRKIATEERPTRPVGRFTLKQIANVDRHYCHFPLPMVGLMRTQVTRRSGWEVVVLVLISDSVRTDQV